MELRSKRTLVVGLMIVAKREADQVNLNLGLNISSLCAEVGINRTYVYEVAERIEEVLAAIDGRRPGRPARPAEVITLASSIRDRLTIEVLDFRLENPGAVVVHDRRCEYAPSFKRFILGKYDELVPAELNRAQFAHYVRVPLDTLSRWIAMDRKELEEENEEHSKRWDDLSVPQEAGETVLRLVELLAAWHGSTREFIPYAAKALGIKAAQVTRTLRILGIIAPRKAKKPKFDGSMQSLEPGSMSVIDGKEVSVHLERSDRWTKKVAHVIEDQATNTGTGVAVARNECAAAAIKAFDEAIRTQGGKPPLGIVVDGKPCYKDAALVRHVEETTVIVPATPKRGENKAQVEGLFSEWERQVGTLNLNDSTPEKLIESAVHEAMRAFLAARNHAPRIEYGGKSRIQVLRESCPSKEQQRRDLAFIRNLKARHERGYLTFKDERSRALLDEGFRRWNLLDKDVTESLRNFLSYCEPEAIKRGFAIFATKKERKVLNEEYDHRYLAKLITSAQEELDLERAEDELLKMCETDRRWWVLHDEEVYRKIVETTSDPKERLPKVAEMAACGGLPISGAYWRKKLREEVIANPEYAIVARTCLKRLYEAPINVRLALIAMIVDVEAGLAM